MSTYTKSNHRHRGGGDGAQVAFGDLTGASVVPQFANSGDNGKKIQAGTASVSLSAQTAKSTAVTFPTAFGTTPRVVVTGTNDGFVGYHLINTVTTTGFNIGSYVAGVDSGGNGGTAITANATVHWVAIG